MVWFRSGRGWYVTEGGSAVKLLDQQGNHITERNDRKGAQHAYAAYLLATEKQRTDGDRMPLMEVCRAYLEHAEKHASPATLKMRAEMLFDFCTGYPPRFRDSAEKPTPKDKIHPGLREKPVGDLIGKDIEKWLDAHPDWNGTRRIAIQAVKRCLNYCKKMGLISANPIRGYKVGQPGSRVVYFTPEQEAAILAVVKKPTALVLQVCIRTGVRPYSEFAELEARHVEETSRGQLWRFPATEHKTGKQTGKPRIIYVPEEIAVIVRDLVKRFPAGKLFRNTIGKPWGKSSLKPSFQRIRKRLAKKGMVLDRQACWYACRHTYAKRMLGGFWGQQVTENNLARLMGTSVAVIHKHYGQWVESYDDPMWQAIGN